MSNVLTNKVAAGAVAVAMIFSFAFAFATPAKAATVEELTAQIASLLATISSLQAQLADMKGGSSATTGGTYNFTKNLKVGMSDPEVKDLQKFLNANGFAVSATGAGSAGHETEYFGSRTKAAVIAWQNANKEHVLAPVGLSAGTGYWGSSSRAYANSLGSSDTTTTGTTTTTPTGTGVTVSAAAQPANGLAVQGASRVPFTKFTITNNSGSNQTINSVTVERGGLMDDSVFSGVVLLDEDGTQLGNAQTLNSVHQATIGEAVTIPAGASRTFTVAGNMASSLGAKAGQVGTLSVVAVNTSATVAGSLPITGAAHTINATLTIGSLTSTTVSSFDPNGAQTKNIGDTGVRFTGLRFTAGSAEDLMFNGIRFRMNGSASASDLANLMVNVNGTDYPATMSADGRYATAMVPGGVLVKKGYSIDVYIKGDIVGSNAAGRKVEFDVDKTSDVYFTGVTYGYGVVPSAGTGTVSTAATHGTTITNSQPWFQGSTISISGASVTSVAKASEVPAANVAVNIPNTTLGGFVLDLKGEPLNVQSLKLHVTYSVNRAAQTDVLTNVTLVDENGQVIAGPADEVGSSVTAGAVTLSSSMTFPTGRHVYTVKGTIDPQIASGTITISTAPNVDWTNVTGQTTGNTITLTTGSFNMNPMTIKAASLAETVAATPVAQHIVAGANDVVLATLRFDASNSGEDIRFSNLPVQFTGNTNLSSCRVKDGSTSLTTGSNVISNPGSTGTFVFDNSLIVKRGTVKSLDIVCNVVGSASGTIKAGMGAASGITATGVDSNNTVTVTGSAAYGQLMTVGTGAVVVSTDAASPSTALVSGGSTGVTLGVWKMRATNEDVRVEKLGLALTGHTQDLTNVTIWNGSTQLAGPVVFTGSTQAVTLTNPLVLSKDTDTTITIKGDIAAIGGSNPGTSGSHLAVNWNNASGNNQFTGVQSGNAITPSGSTSVSGVYAYNSFPTVAKLVTPSTVLTTGTIETSRFSITADANSSISLDQIAVDTSVSGATTTANSLYVYAYSDAAMSQPVAGFASGKLNTTGAALGAGTKVPFSAVLQIPAGATRYFKTVATVTAVATGNSISTKILGDSAYYAENTAANAKGANNFVWADDHNGATATGDAFWTNGFSVAGLPSLGTDTTVLSK